MSKISYFFLSLFLVFLISCSESKSFHKSEGMTWNTMYHITYEYGSDLTDSIQLVLDSIDSNLSYFNSDSEVSALNRAYSSLKIGRMLKDVYNLSYKIRKISDSLFDPTVSPAISAWGFGKDRMAVPDTLTLDSLRQFIGMDKTRISGDTLYKDDPRIEFNFSAVAKGYGVDRVAEMMKRNGVVNYMIEIGGEIRASGHSPSGHKWLIGIDAPEDTPLPGEKPVRTISFTDMGMATSGNYRNYHKDKRGNKYGHTISTMTLRPIQTDLLSVTIMAPTCAEADALATASMAMGYIRSARMIDSLALPALFIVERNGKPVCIPNKKWTDEF